MSTEIRKIVSTDILPIIYNYLNQIGLDSVAKKLQKKSGLDLENSESPLAEKKIQKIVKFYVTNHKHMIQKFIVKKDESESESESEEEVKTKKNKKVEKLNKKRKASKKQSSDNEEEKNDSGNETPIVKKNKKAEKVESDDEENPISTQEEIIPELLEEEELLPGQRKYFQKCDDRKLKYLKPEFSDFTHEAKKRFGTVGDEFGNIGNELLKETRGKGFRKGKDKLKNKNFCGGDAGINIYQVNSIPLC